MSKLVILTVDLPEAKAVLHALINSGLVDFRDAVQYGNAVRFVKKLQKEIERAERRSS